MTANDSPLVKLLGPSLLSKVGKKVSTADAFKGKELVLLYFSGELFKSCDVLCLLLFRGTKSHDIYLFLVTASWCGPCMNFSPLLILFYNKCAQAGKLEIVLISSDKDVESFNHYYGQMPWLALPFESTEIKRKLSDTFQIPGIPTALVLDCKTGNYITDDARNRVKKVAKGLKGMSLELLDSWKGMESVPIEQAAEKIKADNKQHPVVVVLMFLLKNPMLIIGLLYLYKYITLKYQGGGKDAVNQPDL